MSTKISDLTSATSLTGAEEVPIVQTGTTKKTTVGDIQKNANYSTTEQVIGTWIDGKPLYQKVVSNTFGSVGSGTDIVVSEVDISGINYDYIYIENATAIAGDNYIPAQYLSGPRNATRYIFRALITSDGKVSAQTDWSLLSNSTWYAIIKYTKTTD